MIFSSSRLPYCFCSTAAVLLFSVKNQAHLKQNKTRTQYKQTKWKKKRFYSISILARCREMVSCLKLWYYFWQLILCSSFVDFSNLSRNWNENILLMLLSLGKACQHGSRFVLKTQNIWHVVLYFLFIRETMWGWGLFTWRQQEILTLYLNQKATLYIYVCLHANISFLQIIIIQESPYCYIAVVCSSESWVDTLGVYML